MSDATSGEIVNIKPNCWLLLEINLKIASDSLNAAANTCLEIQGLEDTRTEILKVHKDLISAVALLQNHNK